MLTLRLLTLDSPDIAQMRRVNTEAFPENEQVEVENFFRLDGLDVDPLGIYEDDVFVGFIVLMKKAPSAYVFYFAIDQAYRSQGIGGRTLAMLPELYPGLQIVLDAESVEEPCDNLPMRQRRREFYLRNGYRPAGLYLYYMETEFEALYAGGDAYDVEGFSALVQELHEHVPQFSPRMYTK